MHASDMRDLPSSCDAHWTAPRATMPLEQAPVARFPRLALGAQRSFVIGVDIQTFGTERLPKDLLVVREIGRKDIGRPNGQFAFLYPRGAVDAHDRLHLVWAEPSKRDDAIDAKQWLLYRPASVWTAAYDS